MIYFLHFFSLREEHVALLAVSTPIILHQHLRLIEAVVHLEIHSPDFSLTRVARDSLILKYYKFGKDKNKVKQ